MNEPKLPKTAELDELVSQYSDIEFVDAIFADLHGYIRGKRFPIDEAGKIYTSGIQIPDSSFFLDPQGDSGDPCGRGFSDGDPDSTLRPVPGTACYVPWGTGKGAQVLVELYNEDGSSNYSDPRQLAARAVDNFRNLGYRLHIAFELEFYLLDESSDDRGRPRFPSKFDEDSGEIPTQVYSLSDLDRQHEFLTGVQDACRIQGIPSSTTTSEYSPYQYEVNLRHTDDPLAAADYCALLRRIVKENASGLGMRATFMPKPFVDYSGSGMHIHLSMADRSGNNVFRGDDEYGSSLMRQAIGGLLDSMADMFAIFAPGRNSFRRFVPDMFVPVNRTWGYNNRSVAIRIPGGPDHARRLEHRVAGADANPYLVLIAILGGINHGIAEGIDPGEAKSFVNVSAQIDESLPLEWERSIAVFEKSEFAERYFSREYVDLYCAVKRDEVIKYRNYITDRDYQLYL
ncbi:MAG: glutamine synthetase family protein [Acidiferrobacterales bacterium]|nr:glutamine synthetase family protein [Acidiferrobacterales bacterium]